MLGGSLLLEKQYKMDQKHPIMFKADGDLTHFFV